MTNRSLVVRYLHTHLRVVYPELLVELEELVLVLPVEVVLRQDLTITSNGPAPLDGNLSDGKRLVIDLGEERSAARLDDDLLGVRVGTIERRDQAPDLSFDLHEVRPRGRSKLLVSGLGRTREGSTHR
jgi:hypothetical protein